MTTTEQITEHTIDAAGRKLGRLSSEIAVLLMGKNRPDFAPHRIAPVKVTVENAALMDIPEKKKQEKVYLSHSGYPGGQKKRTMQHIIDNKGYGELIKKAVRGMLPKNKLQKRVMKNLIITE